MELILTKWWTNTDKDLIEEYAALGLLLADKNYMTLAEINTAININELITNATTGTKFKLTIEQINE